MTQAAAAAAAAATTTVITHDGAAAVAAAEWTIEEVAAAAAAAAAAMTTIAHDVVTAVAAAERTTEDLRARVGARRVARTQRAGLGSRRGNGCVGTDEELCAGRSTARTERDTARAFWLAELHGGVGGGYNARGAEAYRVALSHNGVLQRCWCTSTEH